MNITEGNRRTGFVDELKIVIMEEGAGEHEGPIEREISRLEAVYQRYVGHVYTLCLRLLADVRAAEEVTMQVFVRFFQVMKRYWNESTILSRLRELAITDSLTRLNACDGEVINSSTETRQPVTSLSFRFSGEERIEPLDATTFDKLVKGLPDLLRIAFVLHDREGLSYKAVATHLRVGEAEARRLVQNARLELSRLLRA